MLIARKVSLLVEVYGAVGLYFICPMGIERKINVQLPPSTRVSFQKPYSRFHPPPPKSDAGLFISTSFSVGKNNSLKRLNTVTQQSFVKFQLKCLLIRTDIFINSADFLS